MIAEHIRVVDIDAEHWANLLDLFAGDKKKKERTIALVLTRDGHAVKTLHSERGVIRGYTLPGTDRLKDVATDLGADVVGTCEVGAFARIFDAAQRAVHYDDDVVRQAIDLFNAGLESSRDQIQWYPAPPVKLRPLKYKRARRVLKWLFPNRRTLFFTVLDDDRVYTSVIVGKKDGEIALLTTLDGVDVGGFDPARWREHAPDLLRAVGKAHGRVFLGIFLEKRTLDELRAGRLPVRFLLEAHIRKTALIKPFPIRWRLLLKIAAWLRRA